MPAKRRPSKVKPPIPLASGDKVGGYELRGLIGRGNFGFVYRVTDPEAEVDLAVREYLPHHLAMREGSRAVVSRGQPESDVFAQGMRFFLNEARLLQRLKHPNLIRVHRVWQENGTVYMAMDLSSGRNLSDTRQSRWLSPREQGMRHFIETLLAPLELLHKNGFQHRDVAPPNIMVEADGRVVLMDMDSPRRLTMAQGGQGGLGPRRGYAPLELYAGGARLRRGPWTDLYELGATVHFLATGKPPTEARERSADEHPGHDIQRSDQRYSLQLLAVIDWMLALNPKDRPQSVSQVRKALAGRVQVPERHLPGRRVRLALLWHRWRRWWWVLPTVLVVLVLGLAVMLQPAPQQVPLVVQPELAPPVPLAVQPEAPH
jgi:serine/threonine protein kinase